MKKFSGVKMKLNLTKNKGNLEVNATQVIGILVLIIVIGYVSITGLTLNSDFAKTQRDALSSSTSETGMAMGNVSSKVARAYGQSSNLPYIYVAVLMIAAILSILGYLKLYSG
jgi:hypothetical protein